MEAHALKRWADLQTLAWSWPGASGNIVEELPFDGTDGAFPVSGMIHTSNGTLFGTTTDEGVDARKVAFGTPFTISGLRVR